MRRKRKRKHDKELGMTLIEIMIVIVIMGLIAGGVALAVFPQLKKAKISDTRTGAQTIRSAAMLWILDHSGECPSTDQLVEDGQLDKGKKTVDAWDNAYTIECNDSEITVSSGGPDEQRGGEDDITVGG